MKLREVAELKRCAAHLQQERLQELEMDLVSTPASWLMDFDAAGVHRASKSTHPPSVTLSPSFRGLWYPSTVRQSPKRAHHYYPHNASVHKGG